MGALTSSSLSHVIETCLADGVHVAVHPESKPPSHTSLHSITMPIPGNSLAAARSPYPFRYFSASRLPDVSTGNVHTGGGITIIIFDRDAKIDLLNSTHLGGLSVELSKPGHAPKALVGLYVPPTSSKYYSLAAELLTWAVA